MDIINDGAAIKIVNGSQSRDIIKAQIKIVEVIKTNIIKIDIGAGALGNIFVPYASVVIPVTANPDALRDAILAMLPSSGGGGGGAGSATEAKQDTGIGLLTTMSNTLNLIQNITAAEVDMMFYTPLRIDDTGANVVYKGYATTGSLETQPVWAVERVSLVSGVEVHEWVNGGKQFNNVWRDREGFTYK